MIILKEQNVLFKVFLAALQKIIKIWFMLNHKHLINIDFLLASTWNNEQDISQCYHFSDFFFHLLCKFDIDFVMKNDVAIDYQYLLMICLFSCCSQQNFNVKLTKNFITSDFTWLPYSYITFYEFIKNVLRDNKANFKELNTQTHYTQTIIKTN